MDIKELIKELEQFDKNLPILVGDEWIGRVDLVVPSEKHAVPYVSIVKAEE